MLACQQCCYFKAGVYITVEQHSMKCKYNYTYNNTIMHVVRGMHKKDVM